MHVKSVRGPGVDEVAKKRNSCADCCRLGIRVCVEYDITKLNISCGY